MLLGGTPATCAFGTSLAALVVALAAASAAPRAFGGGTALGGCSRLFSLGGGWLLDGAGASLSAAAASPFEATPTCGCGGSMSEVKSEDVDADVAADVAVDVAADVAVEMPPVSRVPPTRSDLGACRPEGLRILGSGDEDERWLWLIARWPPCE